MKSKKNVCAIYNIHLLLGLGVVACLLTSRPLRRLPLLFAGAVVILLAVFAFISLLSPPITNHQLYHTNRHSVIILFGSLFKTGSGYLLFIVLRRTLAYMQVFMYVEMNVV